MELHADQVSRVLRDRKEIQVEDWWDLKETVEILEDLENRESSERRETKDDQVRSNTSPSIYSFSDG